MKIHPVLLATSLPMSVETLARVVLLDLQSPIRCAVPTCQLAHKLVENRADGYAAVYGVNAGQSRDYPVLWWCVAGHVNVALARGDRVPLMLFIGVNTFPRDVSGTCDWGECDRATQYLRLSPEHGWLGACRVHGLGSVRSKGVVKR